MGYKLDNNKPTHVETMEHYLSKYTFMKNENREQCLQIASYIQTYDYTYTISFTEIGEIYKGFYLYVIVIDSEAFLNFTATSEDDLIFDTFTNKFRWVFNNESNKFTKQMLVRRNIS